MADKKGKPTSANRKAHYKQYRESGRREVNKAIKLRRHIKRYGISALGEVRDLFAINKLAQIPARIVLAATKIAEARKNASQLGELQAKVRRGEILVAV